MIREYRDNKLYFDGCDTVELAKEYGTPLYVLSENSIVDKCNEIKEAFLDKYDNTRVAYACKALCTLAVLKIMEREGMGLDVVSEGELFTAMAVDFPGDRIEFNGNNKQPSEIDMAVEYGVNKFIVDNVEELGMIEEVCKKYKKRVNVLFRISPALDMDDATHKYITTASKDSKFGIPLDRDVILPVIDKAVKSEWVEFYGIHFHIGSQLMDNDSHMQGLEVALSLITDIHNKLAVNIHELNLGGGFGIKYLESDKVKPFSYFMDPMMERIDDFYKDLEIKRPEIVIEPGRSMVGEAGITLYTIGNIKEVSEGIKYVSIDGGMTDNIRPGLYQAKYEGVIANKPEKTAEETVHISGKCCESTDIIIRDIKLPKAEEGDIFATFSTGAYGYSMANNYNKLAKPAMVLVKDGKSELIVKRQTYTQMIENEIIPKSLDDSLNKSGTPNKLKAVN